MGLHRLHPFPSKRITPRNIDIWFPPCYAQDSTQRYPVLYMHDGQNLFDPELAYIGVDWGVAPAIKRLLAAGNFTPPIVVGIWNTPNRMGEYLPEAPMQDPKAFARAIRFTRRRLGEAQLELNSDAYLAFIVNELKPWVDAHFQTRADQPNTHIAGSSLGGLISMYAICQYPQVFCGAGCVSTAWNFGRGSMISYFSQHLPEPGTHRLYFDMGGRETSLPWVNWQLLKEQSKMDQIARVAGYQDNKSLLSLIFPKHRHNESAWRERVEGLIGFILESRS